VVALIDYLEMDLLLHNLTTRHNIGSQKTAKRMPSAHNAKRSSTSSYLKLSGLITTFPFRKKGGISQCPQQSQPEIGNSD
jgi:hypothetical protein